MRGKKVLDRLKKAGARVIDCPAVKSDGDKAQFAANEFRRQGRKVAPDAVRALVEAVGKDLRELAAACAQLVADTRGVVDEAMVEKYHGGRVEATGFKVADAAIAGNAGEGLAGCFATQSRPVTARCRSSRCWRCSYARWCGSALRAGPSGQLAKTLAWRRGRSTRPAEGQRLGSEAWAGDPGRRRGDFEVKGGGREPVYGRRAHAILTSSPAPPARTPRLAGPVFWTPGAPLRC
jgi:DNA polymerase-3 subunit delta